MIYIHFQLTHLQFKVKIVLETAPVKNAITTPQAGIKEKCFTC